MKRKPVGAGRVWGCSQEPTRRRSDQMKNYHWIPTKSDHMRNFQWSLNNIRQKCSDIEILHIMGGHYWQKNSNLITILICVRNLKLRQVQPAILIGCNDDFSTSQLWPIGRGQLCKFHPSPPFNKLLPTAWQNSAEFGTKANLCRVKCSPIFQTAFLTQTLCFNIFKAFQETFHNCCQLSKGNPCLFTKKFLVILISIQIASSEIMQCLMSRRSLVLTRNGQGVE